MNRQFPQVEINSVRFQVTREPAQIQAFLNIAKTVLHEELKDKRIVIPTPRQLEKRITIVATLDSQVVGGVAIIPYSSGPFEIYEAFENKTLLPDWRLLRKTGKISELYKLYTIPAIRGKVDSYQIWLYFRQVLRHIGSEYVMLSAILDNQVYRLYSSVGFKPIAPPLLFTGWEEGIKIEGSMVSSPRLLMLAKLYDHLTMPCCAYDVDLSRVGQFAKWRVISGDHS